MKDIDLDAARKQPPTGELSTGRKLDYEALIKQFQEEQAALYSAKEKLISKLEQNQSISPKYANLLRSISSSTLGRAGADLRKVEAAVELKDALAREGFSARRMAYIGSGLDFHFPVALGARTIDLVDIVYKDEGSIPKLLERVRKIDSDAQLEVGDRSEIVFQLDVGNGKELTRLRIIPDDVREYQPDEPLGGVIEILGPTKEFNNSSSPVLPNVASRLSRDAIILNFDFSGNDANHYNGLEYKKVGKYGYRVKRYE